MSGLAPEIPDRPGWWWVRRDGVWTCVLVYQYANQLSMNLDGAQALIRFLGSSHFPGEWIWGDRIPYPDEEV